MLFRSAFEALKPGVLGLADSVVEVELGGKVPFAVVGVLTADVVSVEGEKCLVRCHAGSPRIKKLHEEIKLDDRDENELGEGGE